MTQKKLTFRVHEFLTLQNVVLIITIAGTLLLAVRNWYYMEFEIQDLKADMEFVKDLLIKIADSQ